MIAFISSTLHQTWNSIIMAKKLFPQEKCDLFILDFCSSYNEIANELRKEDIFENIYPCQIAKFQCCDIKNPITRKIRKCMYFIGWKHFLRQSVHITKQYDRVFVAFNDEPSCFLMTQMKALNPNIKPCYFEDGANDYIADAHPKHRGFKKFFGTLFGIDYSIGDSIDTTYVVSPPCVASSDYILETIPIIDPDKDLELKAIMNRVFSYDPYVINERSVFLYSPFQTIEFAEKSHQIVHKIIANYGIDKLLFKDHPRVPAVGYDGIRKYPREKETLWECVSMNNDCSNKVLISVISTSMYIPKLLFNQEPILVFLFRLIPAFSNEKRAKSFYEFVLRLRSLYSDPSKVIIPETEEELFAYLDGVMNE